MPFKESRLVLHQSIKCRCLDQGVSKANVVVPKVTAEEANINGLRGLLYAFISRKGPTMSDGAHSYSTITNTMCGFTGGAAETIPAKQAIKTILHTIAAPLLPELELEVIDPDNCTCD